MEVIAENPSKRRAVREYTVAAQLWVAAGAIELALRRRSMASVVSAIGRAAGSPTARAFPFGRLGLAATRLDHLADRASRWWRGGRACLPRALLRSWVAASVGQDAVIVVGVRRNASTPFAAHAWVELDGHVRGERADPTALFQPITRYPVAAGAAPAPRRFAR
jgi:hypothetical protein